MPSTLPITISDSDFTNGGFGTTPLAKIATRMAEAVLNTAWNEALTMKSEFSSKVSALTNETTGFLGTVNTPTVSTSDVALPSVTAPNVTIPASVDTASILANFSSETNALVTLLSDKFVALRNTYFPNEMSAYTAAETWLRDAIANPSGLPDAVATAIWGGDKARILADATRNQNEIVATFAARGFPLPPGAAASAVMQVGVKAQEEVAESSRRVAILSVELQKFSVEKLLGLRGMAMDAAIKYVTAFVNAPETAAKVVGVGYDAQSKLISAASDFYRADTAAQEMVSNVQRFNSTKALDAAVKNQQAHLSIIDDKVKALLAELENIGRMTTSMVNNLHAAAGVTASV